jgi:hypothetical protein
MKEKQSAKVRGREGLAVRIHAWLTDLKKRIDTQSKNAHKGKLEWERLIDRSQPASTHSASYDDALEDIDFDAAIKTPSPLPKAKPFEKLTQPHMPTKPSEKPQMMAVETPRKQAEAGRKPCQTVLPTDRFGLQQAVIWSEILGPPIALRDPFRDNR